MNRALLICDVWDRHWCRSAGERILGLAEKIDAVADRLRRAGTFIIHAPAETMSFYEATPQRARMKDMPRLTLPEASARWEPRLSLPERGIKCPDVPECSEPEGPPWPWTRQHAAIGIGDEDGISDEGTEVYSALRQLGIDVLLMAGIHTDQCVLDRPFGIRQMTSWGVKCALVRDLTEASWPEDTVQVVRYIEQHLCPAFDSHEL